MYQGHVKSGGAGGMAAVRRRSNPAERREASAVERFE
jgi:hypothetical protein